MFRSNSIRPIVLGLAKKDNKILVGQGYDKVKNQTFYRALGGGIEFTETSKDAIIREFKEEINADIIVHDLLDVSENMFTYKGNYGHEIVFIYSIDIPEKFYKEKYLIKDDSSEYTAIWVDIEDFKSGNKILYPDDFLKYL